MLFKLVFLLHKRIAWTLVLTIPYISDFLPHDHSINWTKEIAMNRMSLGLWFYTACLGLVCHVSGFLHASPLCVLTIPWSGAEGRSLVWCTLVRTMKYQAWTWLISSWPGTARIFYSFPLVCGLRVLTTLKMLGTDQSKCLYLIK